MKNLFDLAHSLERKKTCLHNIEAEHGEGHNTFLSVFRERALLEADACDSARHSGLHLSPFSGIPISVKDLFDLTGQVTTAGSHALDEQTDEMAAAAIGTDTGGSTRIPAALCGLVGFKPTAQRVSTQGCIPLSTSLDSVGPIANSVTCCALLDAIMAGDNNIEVEPFPEVGLRLGVLNGFAMEELDHHVAAKFDDALQQLGKRGILIKSHNLPEVEKYFAHINRACLVGAEAYTYHEKLIEQREEYYDPWVLERIKSSNMYSAKDYIDTLQRRADCQEKTLHRNIGLDAIALPAVPLMAKTVPAKSTNFCARRNTNSMQ